jgi:hypothetical protein
MNRVVVVVAALAAFGMGCAGDPPATPVDPIGAGCRELKGTVLAPVDQSISWDGTYGGILGLYDNTTCAGAPFARWASYRHAGTDDPVETVQVANELCSQLAADAVGDPDRLIGPFTYTLRSYLEANRSDASGVPDDLWMCAAAYRDLQGNVRNWPTDPVLP